MPTLREQNPVHGYHPSTRAEFAQPNVMCEFGPTPMPTHRSNIYRFPFPYFSSRQEMSVEMSDRQEFDQKL
ncbi:hypothetical protein GCM10010464_52300 [Pseudonocardia yunnanensis]